MNDALSTTHLPSQFIFRSKASKARLLKLLLKKLKDVPVCQKAFEECYNNNSDTKIFKFDSCISEPNGHNLQKGLQESLKFISETQNPSHIFLFGSRDARKS